MRRRTRRVRLRHPVIHTPAELRAHDPWSPAYLLVPPALVRPLWLMLAGLTRCDELGRLYRGLELLLVCVAEPDTRGTLTSYRLIGSALLALLQRARGGGGGESGGDGSGDGGGESSGGGIGESGGGEHGGGERGGRGEVKGGGWRN